jgi:hypothetical protein
LKSASAHRQDWQILFPILPHKTISLPVCKWWQYADADSAIGTVTIAKSDSWGEASFVAPDESGKQGLWATSGPFVTSNESAIAFSAPMRGNRWNYSKKAKIFRQSQPLGGASLLNDGI